MRVLQFGTGVFIRGFFDWMLQELANKKLVDAKVSVVKLTANGSLDSYKNQKGCFHTVIRGLSNGIEVNEISKIDRIDEFINPYSEWQDLLDTATKPEFKLVVSNSTEAGLCYEGTSTYQECPGSFPAKLYAWLKRRYETLGKGGAVGIMAFELVPDNATKLKGILLKLANDDNCTEEFESWLLNDCYYVNTLVDRIVSKLPPEESEKLQKAFDVQDDLILCAEPYHLLAVDSQRFEDVLPLSKAGLNIEHSQNLDKVRERKVKVLNGAHMLVVPAGLALGHEIVLETLEDSKILSFAEDCLNQEIAATVNDPNITSYIDSVIERFKNPFLGHRLENIALNSSAKIGQRLFPSIVDYYEQSGRFPERLLIAIAIFIDFYKGESIAEGALKTDWGVLKDSPESMDFMLNLQKLTALEAVGKITNEDFWKIPNNMKSDFINKFSEVLETVRVSGTEEILERFV